MVVGVDNSFPSPPSTQPSQSEPNQAYVKLNGDPATMASAPSYATVANPKEDTHVVEEEIEPPRAPSPVLRRSAKKGEGNCSRRDYWDLV